MIPTSRVPELGMLGSVGAPGGQPPGATRRRGGATRGTSSAVADAGRSGSAMTAAKRAGDRTRTARGKPANQSPAVAGSVAPSDSLGRLVGRRLTEFALVYDTSLDCDHPDEPVVLCFARRRLELRALPVHAIGMTWNTIDLRRPPMLPGLEDEPDIIWKRFRKVTVSSPPPRTTHSRLPLLARHLGSRVASIDTLVAPHVGKSPDLRESRFVGIRFTFEDGEAVLIGDKDHMALVDSLADLASWIRACPVTAVFPRRCARS